MKVKEVKFKSAETVQDDFSSDSDSGGRSCKDDTTNRILKANRAETMKVKEVKFKSAETVQDDFSSDSDSGGRSCKDDTTNSRAERMKVKGGPSKSAETVTGHDLSDSDSDSMQDSRNNNDNNANNEATTKSFECPPGFQQVEISAEDEQIYLDDIQGSEFWLIKTPHDFDAKRLNGVNVSLSGRQFLKEDDDSEVSYELHASKNKALDMRLPHLLLPSQRGEKAKLVPAPAFTGSLAVMETVAIPPVLLPPSPPKRSNELPPGLKQRFKPFGWEDPNKCDLRTKKSLDVTDSSIQKTKKKNSHKHKKPQEETSSPTDEDLSGRHGGDKGEERLPSGGGEEERDDEDDKVTDGKKKHRRSKKRKHQQREDIKVEKTSEETPKKKKKKKHKSLAD
ncbi:DNA-directed RNA polymerase I subunit RPA34-like isoform X2 [Asterias rubens]|nr:DNA-directed RNA polymerase I subunit RPA34-like isoform X2 [Asterias rubens]XP_033648114.1 DNA-directed RNA polymerase I subunit RPA34-like isoform X2 [Asterias rubens]